MQTQAVWILSSTGNPRFPYRVEIRRGEERILALWLQNKWPGSGKQIFCLREGGSEDEAAPDTTDFDEIERVQITHLERYGKQLSVVLDRPTRKRCNFLFLEKRYKNKPGTYEQIFFRTQTGMQQHRSGSRVQLHAHGAYRILIDSGERYPWRFTGPPTERRRLPVGDYALELDGALAAILERKTFENILSDFAALRVLHAKLDDLGRWEHAAMVIEAEYRDFLSPRKLKGRWPASHAARVLAELHVLHPSVQIVYAGSRKSAEQWADAWFAARAKDIWHRNQDDRTFHGRPSEREQRSRQPAADIRPVATQLLGEPPPVYGSRRVRNTRDTAHALRSLILVGDLPDPFTIQDLRLQFPDLPDQRIRSTLQALKQQGRLERVGSGRRSAWRRCAAE